MGLVQHRGPWRSTPQRTRNLLEISDLPVDRIAAEVGFTTGASLRQHLHAAIGVSPHAYRNTFRAHSRVPSRS